MKVRFAFAVAGFSLAMSAVAMATDVVPTVSEAQVQGQLSNPPPVSETSEADSGQTDISGVREKKMALWSVPTGTAAPRGPVLVALPGAAKSSLRRSGRPRYATTSRYSAPIVGPNDMRVTFESGSADMTPGALANLEVYARVMRKPEFASGGYSIEGHTDSVGKRADNLLLSERRAQAVVSYLVSQGVSARLTAKGFGPDKPRVSGRSAASNAANRRVEIYPQK